MKCPKCNSQAVVRLREPLENGWMHVHGKCVACGNAVDGVVADGRVFAWETDKETGIAERLSALNGVGVCVHAGDCGDVDASKWKGSYAVVGTRTALERCKVREANRLVVEDEAYAVSPSYLVERLLVENVGCRLVSLVDTTKGWIEKDPDWTPERLENGN